MRLFVTEPATFVIADKKAGLAEEASVFVVGDGQEIGKSDSQFFGEDEDDNQGNFFVQEDFSKALASGGMRPGHQYIKRTGVPGNYQYWYKLPSGRVVASKQVPHVSHVKSTDWEGDKERSSKHSPVFARAEAGIKPRLYHVLHALDKKSVQEHGILPQHAGNKEDKTPKTGGRSPAVFMSEKPHLDTVMKHASAASGKPKEELTRADVARHVAVAEVGAKKAHYFDGHAVVSQKGAYREKEHRRLPMNTKEGDWFSGVKQKAGKVHEHGSVLSLLDKHHPGWDKDLKRGDTTADLYKKGGEYEEWRKKMHQEIKDHFLKNSPSVNKPVAVLTGGGSASGKGAVLDKMREDGKVTSDAVHIDADEIKKKIPEYEEMVKNGDDSAAAHVHAESSDLSSDLIKESIKGRKNFVYDSTFSKPEKFEKLIATLKEEGYHVHIAYADLPEDIAVQRAEKRAKETGRKVPSDIIHKSHEGATKTLGVLHNLVHSIDVYSTKGGKPVEVYSRTGEQKKVDEGHLKDMHSRGHVIKSEKKEKLKDQNVEEFLARLRKEIKTADLTKHHDSDFKEMDVDGPDVGSDKSGDK